MDSTGLTGKGRNINQLLKPILRAYIIGYLSSTTPRVISSLRQVWRNDSNYQQKRRVYQYRERITFAVSAALLLTCLQERPGMVRGVFGRIATSVLK
ncbi:hypothetical protein G4B84_005436 [Aspergillus flavus NRRL3357]|nr:uncharacterized protein G4B84_005436 [Aspergillus flavus NRRL3357]QMW30101.1 hypothetical protein G4B84_005436 [Aspergillus flavus NRRL3357]QMW42173.1 hypothetical protein G4B11_005497 [Aspergillus flavus]